MNIAQLTAAIKGDATEQIALLHLLLTTTPPSASLVLTIAEIQAAWNHQELKLCLWKRLAVSTEERKRYYDLWMTGVLPLNDDDAFTLGELLLNCDVWFEDTTWLSDKVLKVLIDRQSEKASYLLFTGQNHKLAELVDFRTIKKWIKECPYPYFNKKYLFNNGLFIATSASNWYSSNYDNRENRICYTGLSDQNLIAQTFWGTMLKKHAENIKKDRWANALLNKTVKEHIKHPVLMDFYFFHPDVSDMLRLQWLTDSPTLSQNTHVAEWFASLKKSVQYGYVFTLIRRHIFHDALSALTTLLPAITAYPIVEQDYVDARVKSGTKSLLERMIHWHFFGVDMTMAHWQESLQGLGVDGNSMNHESLKQQLEKEHDISHLPETNIHF